MAGKRQGLSFGMETPGKNEYPSLGCRACSNWRGLLDCRHPQIKNKVLYYKNLLYICIVGGKNENDPFTAATELFDTKYGWSFRTRQGLPIAVKQACMAAINSTHAILSGGTTAESTSNSVFIYDKESNSWTTLQDIDRMPKKRYGLVLKK